MISLMPWGNVFRPQITESKQEPFPANSPWSSF